VGADESAGVVRTELNDAARVRGLGEGEGLIKAPLQAQTVSKYDHGASGVRVVIAQCAPTDSEALTKEWHCLSHLALVMQELPHVGDGDERVTVLIPQCAPTASEDFTKEWLCLSHLALVMQ
jgi:hypothetical protein